MAVRSYTPDNIRIPNFGLLLLNPRGSSVWADTGRDAAHLAQATQQIVIAADRPGSGFARPGQGRKLAQGYAEAFKPLVDTKIRPLAEKLGLDGLAVVGRSAAGLAALVVAAWCGDCLPIVGVNAQEAVGWTNVTSQLGREQFEKYERLQNALLSMPQLDIIRPDPTDQTVMYRRRRREAAMLINNYVDMSNNTDVWRQDLALTSTYAIAEQLPTVRADLIFAYDSLVLGPRGVRSLARRLPELRADSAGQEGWQPVTVQRIPNTVHKSHDKRELFASLVNTSLAELFGPPPPVVAVEQ